MKRLFVLLILSMGGYSAAAEDPAILVFGDSLSAGYGLEHGEEGWVGMLRAKLKAAGYVYRVINASVSGETTAGGLARLPRALDQHRPRIVVLELGGNDGLRALPIDQMRANLSKMIDLSKADGARVLVVGMRIPPNYGANYADQFYSTFGQVAKSADVALVPFFLADVALAPDLMQADGLHPNVAGQPKMLQTVWPQLEPLLRR
ncbi:MAG: arylesterase [Steroidobacteraceae bacterium]